MRVLFLGTPDFAAIPLEALARDSRYQVVGAVTQPDRPAGRGRAPEAPPVKRAAQSLGIPVLQPETLRDPAVVEQLAALRPDVGVVAAYGEILRKNVLAIPPLGYLNIHPSLLPRHRGPTPVPGAILAGDTETGVTVMLLDAKMDSGPIIAQQRVPLPPDARSDRLTEELFKLGTTLLLEALPGYAAGAISPTSQDDRQATYTNMLKKEDGAIDWGASASQIERMTRAYHPWPGAQTLWRGQPFKIIAAQAHPGWSGGSPPGTLLPQPDGLWVATGAGALELLTVQPSGKRPLAAAEWRRGLREIGDAKFGE
jgi:methionyl-tRNA formyltransferase